MWSKNIKNKRILYIMSQKIIVFRQYIAVNIENYGQSFFKKYKNYLSTRQWTNCY